MQDSQPTEFKGDILIVDDVLPNLKALSMLLEEQSYAVRGALSGSVALRMIDAQPPDLVLLDIRMPEMDGYDVCRRLKADEKTRDIPVIFISAASELTEKMQGFAVGGVDYITKPIQAEEVLARVKTHLTLRNLQAQLEAQNAQLRHEIAERKQAEEELIRHRDHLEELVAERTAELRTANAELARAARLKDEFLAAMSHELRTPLNAILGLSEALQDQVYGSLNEKQLESLHTIETSGGRLLALINNILDMAKIGAGQLELQIAPFYVEQVCEASLEAIKQAARKKRLRVASTFDSAVTTIQVDGQQLKQILINMLSNAVKFTPENGAIGLEVAGDMEGEAVHFTVWDTGIGISQEDMERLFGGPGNSPQLFVQLDGSLARRYEGTGLGLALVRHLAEMHGGGVTVESEVGKGSRFTVSLPWRVRPERS